MSSSIWVPCSRTAWRFLLFVLLLQEQRRTNRLLQSVLYAGLGFVLGLIVAQAIVRFQLF